MTTFRDDEEFLRGHTDVIVLEACKPALVAVTPHYQGRVMTSSPLGPEGPSLGWVNRKFIAAGLSGTAFDNYGGEDRFWLGPEGGQHALWFAAGEPFDLAHWRTPRGFNTGAFAVTSQGASSVAMAARFEVVNYCNTSFDVAVRRVVSVLSPERLAEALAMMPPAGAACVGFQSANTVANVGSKPWQRETGLLSAWILGQFQPLPRGLVIVPFIPGGKKVLGELPNGEYFGPIPADRFRIQKEHVLFRCDGQYRSKLGVSPRRAKHVLGSFDPDANLLTIVQFNLPGGAPLLPYVNSLWQVQPHPYAGDVVNSYNDGQEYPGAGQLGPFYEIETSSAAAELAPNEAITHVHRTFHFTGEFDKLNQLAIAQLGIDLETIVFPI